MKHLFIAGFLTIILLLSGCSAEKAASDPASAAPAPTASSPAAQTPTAAPSTVTSDSVPVPSAASAPAPTTISPAASPAAAPPAASPKPAVRKEVEISGHAFNPSALTIPEGTTVIWTNKDYAPHDVISNTRVFASKRLSKDNTFERTFNTTGTYSYHCSFHPSMKGKIIVE